MKKIKLKEVESACAFAACPSVYRIEGEEEQLVIVGNKLNPKDLEGANINQDEAAVMVDKGMIENLLKQN